MGLDHLVAQGQRHVIHAMVTDKLYHRGDFFKFSRPAQIVAGPDKSLKIRAPDAEGREGQRN